MDGQEAPHSCLSGSCATAPRSQPASHSFLSWPTPPSLNTQVDEFDTDEEDGGGMGLVRDEDARSSISSKRSARSARSRK